MLLYPVKQNYKDADDSAKNATHERKYRNLLEKLRIILGTFLSWVCFKNVFSPGSHSILSPLAIRV